MNGDSDRPAASRWAIYRPEALAASSPDGLTIRTAEAGDCSAIAGIEASRDGVEVESARRRCQAQVVDVEALLLVAVVSGAVVAFARAGRLRPPIDAPADSLPDGWYLLGVIVVDAWRRHGIGRDLSRARLAWIAERADVAYYFVNAGNRASIDLHRDLGFVEISREFSAPGVVFEGGHGVLCRLYLPSPVERR